VGRSSRAAIGFASMAVVATRPWSPLFCSLEAQGNGKFVVDATGQWSYLDKTKPVKVRNPTLWQRIRYFFGKLLAVVIAALGLGYPIVHYLNQSFHWVANGLYGQYDWLFNRMETLIALPIAAVVVAALMWFKGAGHYYTPQEWNNMRQWAFGSTFTEIIDKYGLDLACKFMTPFELRQKLLKQSQDNVDVLMSANALALNQALVLLPEELEVVNDTKQAFRTALEEKERASALISRELDDATAPAAKARDRKIEDAKAAYEASAEVRLHSLLTSKYLRRLEELQKERDKKLKAITQSTATAAEKARKSDQAKAKYEKEVESETTLYETQVALNEPNLVKKQREKEEQIEKAKEEFGMKQAELMDQLKTRQRLRQVADEYNLQVGVLTSKWTHFVSEEMDRNSSKIPDRVPVE
jgi:hypothetical protein